MEKNEKSAPVKNVFKSGTSTITKEQFTKTWISLVNTLEKGEGLSLAQKRDER